VNSKERVLKAMSFEEPDFVPIAEISVDVNLMERILGVKPDVPIVQGEPVADRRSDKAYYELVYGTYEKLGFDIVYAEPSLPDNHEPKRSPDGRYVDEIGRVYSYDRITKTYFASSSVFNTEEDVGKFLQEVPDPYAPGRDFGLRQLAKLNRADMALGVAIRDAFPHVWEALTPVKFVYWMYSNPIAMERSWALAGERHHYYTRNRAYKGGIRPDGFNRPNFSDCDPLHHPGRPE
jgi:hypothetical protein